jgi:hypothetical protein
MKMPKELGNDESLKSAESTTTVKNFDDFSDLVAASQSSSNFWDNSYDDGDWESEVSQTA